MATLLTKTLCVLLLLLGPMSLAKGAVPPGHAELWEAISADATSTGTLAAFLVRKFGESASLGGGCLTDVAWGEVRHLESPLTPCASERGRLHRSVLLAMAPQRPILSPGDYWKRLSNAVKALGADAAVQPTILGMAESGADSFCIVWISSFPVLGPGTMMVVRQRRDSSLWVSGVWLVPAEER
jgi:hypothetical protein